MTHEPHAEPVAEIRATALRCDPEFTEVMFKKWRTAGLLPRPMARPGRGRGPGRNSLYPAGTTAHLCRVLELRATTLKAGRRFQPGKVRWQLWWEGWPIETTRIRADLADRCGEIAALVAAMWCDGQPTAFCQDQVTAMAAGNLPSPLRQVRQRVGRERFAATCFLLLELLAGTFTGWNGPVMRADFLRATGLDRGRQDRIGTAPPWLRGSLDAQLRTLSQLVQPSAMRDALEATTDAGLIEARTELHCLLDVLHRIRTLVDQLRGPGAFGLALVPDPEQMTPSLQQLLLLGWLSLRRQSELREGYRAIMETAALLLGGGGPCSSAGSLMGARMPPRRQQPSGGVAHGERSSTCKIRIPEQRRDRPTAVKPVGRALTDDPVPSSSVLGPAISSGGWRIVSGRLLPEAHGN